MAGNGTFNYSDDGGSATGAKLSTPYGVAGGPSENLYKNTGMVMWLLCQ